MKKDLFGFAKETSLRTNGWTAIFFFLQFFEIFGPHMLSLVDETRNFGRVSEAINSTFIVLTHKNSNPYSFNEFKSISLINVVYKLISKIVASNLKGYMSENTSKEQFEFLNNRQTLDVVGFSQ